MQKTENLYNFLQILLDILCSDLQSIAANRLKLNSKLNAIVTIGIYACVSVRVFPYRIAHLAIDFPLSTRSSCSLWQALVLLPACLHATTRLGSYFRYSHTFAEMLLAAFFFLHAHVHIDVIFDYHVCNLAVLFFVLSSSLLAAGSLWPYSEQRHLVVVVVRLSTSDQSHRPCARGDVACYIEFAYLHLVAVVAVGY